MTNDSPANYISSFSSTILPTTVILLKNSLNQKEVRVAAFFHQDSQKPMSLREESAFCSWRRYVQEGFILLRLETRNVNF